MQIALILIAVLIVALVAVVVIKAFAFGRDVRARSLQLVADQAGAVRDDLPGAVAAFATRGMLGAAPGRAIRIRQDAHMRLRMGGAWRDIPARQTIATTRSGFAWSAGMRAGILPLVRVLDAFDGGSGRLEVRLLGAFRLSAETGDDVALGEGLRYLAELPWAPDAILTNRDVTWAETPDGVTARIDTAGGPAEVTFGFDDAGDIVTAFAKGRPTTLDDGTRAELDWRGQFSDYAEIGGRRIPRQGEVGYDYPDGYESYFRCRITALKVIA